MSPVPRRTAPARDATPTTAISSTATTVKISTSPGTSPRAAGCRCTGSASRYRSVPTLASPATASPAMAATASGRNSGSSTVNAASPTNRPLLVAWPMNPRAAAAPRRAAVLDGERDDDRHRREHRPARRCCGAGRRSTSVPTAGIGAEIGRRGRRQPVADRAASAADTEALPGQGDEHVFQVHRHRPEGEHRHPVLRPARR